MASIHDKRLWYTLRGIFFGTTERTVSDCKKDLGSLIMIINDGRAEQRVDVARNFGIVQKAEKLTSVVDRPKISLGAVKGHGWCEVVHHRQMAND